MDHARDDENVPFLHPVQFFGARRARGEGERRLMVALLEDAVGCYQRYCGARSRHGRRLFREAEHWIMDEHARGPLSFRVVCELLGLPPDHLRRGLRRWRAAHAASGEAPATHATHAAA
ncbi:MAG TPA: hypothetical protein VKW76_12425 [Candidatus Binatia bacterium]|nr:hypothetical protein [Candidatus Binatia bacterium]